MAKFNSSRNIAIFVVLAALLFFAIKPIFAQTSEQYNFRTLPWELMAVLAIFASFSAISFAYMLSKVFGISELGGWARDESYQLIAMALIVFFVFCVSHIEAGLFESFGYTSTSDTQNPAIASASDYLKSVRAYVGSSLSSVYVTNTIIQKWSLSYEFFSNKNTFGQYIMPLDISEGYDKITEAFTDILGIVNNAFGAVLGLTTGQIIFLDLINKTAFTILLPLGIFLRIFSFSRGIGTFFIAISIAFYLVYPLTFLLNQRIVDHLLGSEGAWKDIVKARTLQSPVAGEILSWGDLATNSIETSRIGKYVDLYTGMARTALSGAAYVSMAVPFTLLEEGAYAFVLFTVIPILDFVITLGISRELGSLLGGDVSFGKLLTML